VQVGQLPTANKVVNFGEQNQEESGIEGAEFFRGGRHASQFFKIEAKACPKKQGKRWCNRFTARRSAAKFNKAINFEE